MLKPVINLVLAVLVVAAIAVLFVKRLVIVPKVGDVYVEYIDRRNDQWALINGFQPQVVCVHKVVAVSNGVAYMVNLCLPITDTGEYPFPYNEWGRFPISRNTSNTGRW